MNKKPAVPLVKKHVSVGKYPGQTQSSLNSTEITNRSKRIPVSLPKFEFVKKVPVPKEEEDE